MVGNGNAGDNSLDGFFWKAWTLGKYRNCREIWENMGKIGENGKSLIWMNA